MLNKNLQEPLKFLAVGLINTAVGAAAMFVLYNIFHAGYWVSSAANYILGSVCSFFLNKYFTLGSKRLRAKEAELFVLSRNHVEFRWFCQIVSHPNQKTKTPPRKLA